MSPVPENYCGPCYGANPDDKENQCCNTCDEVLRAYAGMGWHSSPDDYEQVKEKKTKCNVSLILLWFSADVKDGKKKQRHKQKKDVVCMAQLQ